MHIINIKEVKCLDERNEASASEEIYALVTSVKLSKVIPNLPNSPVIPSFEVFLYGVWEDFDEGEIKQNQGPPFWPIFYSNPANIVPEKIEDRDDVIFIVTLMENDNGDPGQYRMFVKSAAAASLASTVNAPRAAKAASLIKDITDNLNGIDMPIPFALDDDHIGTGELRLRSSDLTKSCERVLTFDNSEGFYDVYFTIAVS